MLSPIRSAKEAHHQLGKCVPWVQKAFENGAIDSDEFDDFMTALSTLRSQIEAYLREAA